MIRRAVFVRLGVEGSLGRELAAPMTISFAVEHTRDASPSTATIEVINARPGTVAELQRDRAAVELYAGYEETGTGLLFRGSPVKNGCEEKRPGSDRVLTIEASDGGRAWTTARTSITTQTEQTVGQVLNQAAADLGLPLADVTQAADFRYPYGLTLQGPTRSVLDRLAAATGSEWWIRDGELVFVPRNSPTGRLSPLFSAADGTLIGEAAPKDDGSVIIRGTLRAQMRPGRPFRVESEAVTGDYVANVVRFRGSTRGPDYWTEIEGTPA